MQATSRVPHTSLRPGMPSCHPIPGRSSNFLSLLTAPTFSAQREAQAGASSLGSSISRGGEEEEGQEGGVSKRPSPRGPRCPSPLALIAVAARPTPPARVLGRARTPHGPDGGDPGFRGRRAPLSSSLAVRERQRQRGEGEAGCCPSRPLSLRDSASSRQEVKVPGGVRMAQLNCGC